MGLFCNKHSAILSTFIKLPFVIKIFVLSIASDCNNVSNYNLCNSQNLHSVATRTNLYYNSFLSSVIRDWDDLPYTKRQLDTVNTFKAQINRETIPEPKYCYKGNRKAQILHTRLRTHCSSLNMDL